ncbi:MULTISPECIES: DUF2631 domain-containing protein [unclassified Geodermatophilus]
MSEQHGPGVRQHNPATTRVNQPNREEGVVRAGEHPIEEERPEDWGWHGRAGKWAQIVGWLMTLAILSYLWGNHEARMEDLWLLAIAGLMAGSLLWDLRRKRTAWRP